MVSFNRLFLVIFLIQNALVTVAQEPIIIDDHIIEEKIENIGENFDEDADFSTLLDNLTMFLRNPLELNKAEFQDLSQLGILTPFQIKSLLDHKIKHGDLLNIYEIQTIDGFDLETIFRILPYINVSASASFSSRLKADFKTGKHQFFLRHQYVLETQKGFDKTDPANINIYPGSRDKIYTRYRFSSGSKISWGFTLEKDAGEEFFKGTQKPSAWYKPYQGFDYHSAHMYFKDLGAIKKVAVGDYQLEYGQGLVMWSGLSFGKSIDVMGIKKNGIGIKPYTSVNENLFLRGSAVSFGYKNLTADVFYSSNHLDGSITLRDTLDQIQTFSSFQESGFHRTPTELNNRKAIGRTISGVHLGLKKNNLDLGVTGMRTLFDASLNRTTRLYNRFEFTGNELLNAGIHYSYLFRNFNFFGEAGYSDNNGKAFLNGMLISLDQKAALSILHRSYGRNYHALTSNPLSESNNSNEQGILIGFTSKPGKGWTLSAYMDNFSYPWLKYLVDGPSQGFEYTGQLNYTPTKKFDIYARYRQTKKQKNGTGLNSEIDPLITYISENIRFNLSHKTTRYLTLKSRVELSKYNRDDRLPSYGYLIYQDVSYRSPKYPLNITVRYALFDTDDYDSRIYAYESDILYVYSIPAFYNRGSRFYVTTKYKLAKNLDCWLRYGQTYFSNRATVGSGLDLIDGRTKSEIKSQIRYTF